MTKFTCDNHFRNSSEAEILKTTLWKVLQYTLKLVLNFIHKTSNTIKLESPHGIFKTQQDKSRDFRQRSWHFGQNKTPWAKTQLNCLLDTVQWQMSFICKNECFAYKSPTFGKDIVKGRWKLDNWIAKQMVHMICFKSCCCFNGKQYHK